ncbi:hypothetical protein [Klebsiella aerogenes]|uniref:hypothetical protein n=1 Tax=Klebsiella aerogenes TaxID=548 RepID=UPI00115E833A|nr:hypothetical protein [Klebsiella aerogenes]
MTDINRLITSIKRRRARAKEFGHNVLFVKLEDLDVLVEALETAQVSITERQDCIVERKL